MSFQVPPPFPALPGTALSCVLFQYLRALTYSLTIPLPVPPLDFQFLALDPIAPEAVSTFPVPLFLALRFYPSSFQGPRGLPCPSHPNLGHQLPT